MRKNVLRGVVPFRFYFTLFLLFTTVSMFATDFYSTGSGDFTTTTLWDDGSGNNPVGLSDFQNGANTFTIKDGHTITVNDSINCAGITVGEGSSGVLTFGNDETSRVMIVQGTFTVDAGAVVNVSANAATHKLYLQGDLSNAGTITFRNSTSQVVNVFLDGASTISGAGTETFNNIEQISSTFTASKALNIDGNLIINSGATFNASTYTINLAGNFTNDGSFSTSGIFDFDATLVQSISTRATFNDVIFSNGGIASIGANITVNGSLEITENTKVTTASTITVKGDFTVNSGSEYEATNGYLLFYGTSTQTITVTDDCEFDRIYFDNGGSSNKKTIIGDIVIDDYVLVYSDAYVVTTDKVTFKNGFDLRGTWDFSGDVYLSGGTYRNDYNDGTDTQNKFYMGTADVFVEAGSAISGGDTMYVAGNFTIEDGYLVLNNRIRTTIGDTVDARLIGTSSKTLTVKTLKTLYMRGKDNFPEGFGSIVLENGSYANYDANFSQTVKGGVTYGNLRLSNYKKTATDSIVVENGLNLYSPNTDSVFFDMGNHNLHVRGSLTDNYDTRYPNRICYFTCNGNFYLDGEDTYQSLQARTGGEYVFNNIYIQNINPTAARTKHIYGDIIVNNDFIATNTTDNELLYMFLDDDDGIITGGNEFKLGSNVVYATSRQDNDTTVRTFNTITLDANSTIRFDGIDQIIPGDLSYGNIEISGDGIKSFTDNLDINGSLSDTWSGTPVFTSGASSLVVNIAGDWLLESNNVNIDKTCTIIFDGADQAIGSTTLPNVTLSGSGVKTITGTVTIESDMMLGNGVEFDADNRYLYIGGDWDNNSTGTFHQEGGRITFNGAGAQQVYVQNVANSTFYDLYITKVDGDTVYFNTDIEVDRQFVITENSGNLNLLDNTVYIGGDWYIYNGCELVYTAGAKMVFNGNSTEQLIRNYNASTIYPDMEFSGSALKRLYQNAFDINGDFYINNTTVSGEWFNVNVSGDWINAGGTFNHYRTVTFDGDDQLIDGTTFDDIVFGGTGTKTLNGNITLTGWLKIDTTATLDVSPDGGTNSYNITVEEGWYNNEWNSDSTKTGKFIPRSGTVSFIGNYSNIYTGDSIDSDGNGRVGKQFYNLTINKVDNSHYARLYAIEDDTQTKTEGNDLRVLNDFTLNSGIFYTYWNDIYVGGDFENSGGYFNMNQHRDSNSTLTLEGTSGILEFNPGEEQYFRKVVIDGGATYQLKGDLEIHGDGGDNGDLTVVEGTLDMNSNNITMSSTIGDVTVYKNGKLALDSAAILTMPNDRWLRNLGGTIEIIGNSLTPARVTSTDHFYFIQDSGTIAAKYYVIENTRDSGLNVRGGTIDPTYSLSYGSFAGGEGNSYLTLDGIDLGSGITATEVTFTEGSSGPTYNVQRLSGNGVITFQDYSGTFGGSSHENDGGNLIDWPIPSGTKLWDGGGDKVSWNDAANWSDNAVPTASDDVILDKTYVTSDYTVQINSGAQVEDLTLEVSGVGLTLNDSLTVNGDLIIKSGATLSQTDNTDTLRLKGDWYNSGTYECNTGVVLFDLLTNSFNINNTDTIYQLVIDGQDGVLYMSSKLLIKDSIIFKGATLSATNKDIFVKGSWTMDGGIFDAGSGEVIFNNNDENTIQYVKGGDFYDFKADSASTKVIVGNISVENNFTIESTSVVDGKTAYIFVGRRWRNRAGEGGFDQTGSGTVVFNKSWAYIGEHDAVVSKTIFNNLIIQGTSTKYLADSIKIKGSLTNQSGTNLYLYDDVAIDGIGTNNTFTVTGGTVYICGENNFPENFENIDLQGGTVRYQSDTLQYIYPTTYYSLRVQRQHADSLNKKVLLGDIEVKGTLYVGDVETLLDVDDHTITLTGGISFPEGGRQIDWGNGEVIHVGGNWNIDKDITQFNDFTKKGTGRVLLYNDLTFTGNVVFYDETNLNMSFYKMTCTGADKTFIMGAGSYIYTYVADTAGVAFPQGFTSYSLDITNRTYLRGNMDQEIFTGVEYGTLYLYDNSTKTIVINGDLKVRNEFHMSYDGITFNDNGNDVYIGGRAEFRKYTPTNTIYFNGSDDQYIYASGAYTTLGLNNVIVRGGGEKNFDETTIDINGKLKVESGVTFYSNDNINFSGDSLINEGTFSHTYRLFTFDGADQVIDPGADNDFYGVTFDGSGTKKFINHGIDANNGVFTIEDGVTVDLGALTHHIAAEKIEVNGTGVWSTADADIYFDRNGTQYLPALTINNIFLATGGRKYLRGDISVKDLNVESNVYFYTSESSTAGYTITLTGNWLNEGYFYAYKGTVYFESDDVSAKTITSNGRNFNIVEFNQTNTSSRTYSLLDNMMYVESMSIGNGATLNLNGYNLTVGDNDADIPDGETLTVESGATLKVDGGANLQFNMYDGNPKLDVYGTLEVVGDPGLNANITRSGGYNTRGTEITIYSGATIKAKNYHFQYLAPTGLVVQDGATIDNTNNFSDGIWSNIYPYNQYDDPQDNSIVIDTFIYLDVEIVNLGGLDSIRNVTFNHSRTPTVGRHFNVKRIKTATDTLFFAGTINGLMAGEVYEMDEGNKIEWPPVTQLVWTGNVSTDWFDANNWDALITPTKTHNVIIPLVSNNPVIYKQGAVCANLEITDGILAIESGVDSLVVSGNVQVGSDGILAIADDAEIKVSGDWNVALDGTFMAGNSTVTFVAPTGSVVISPHGSEFNNIVFDGTASFFLDGTTNTIAGNFLLKSGQFIPNNNNYILTIEGDYTHAGGDFSKTPNIGFVDFAGVDQTITDGDFSKVKFSNNGNKTIVNSLNTAYENGNYNYSTFIVTDTATVVVSTGCTMNIKGNVYIDSLATFNDGNETHHFTGAHWTGYGAYTGTGTIVFDGRAQYIHDAKFNNLTLTEEPDRNDTKYLYGNVIVNGDFVLDAYNLYCYDYQLTGTSSGTYTQNATTRIFVQGADNYPISFGTYSVDATSYAFYNGGVDQTIRQTTYGNLYIDGTNTKTLEGAIVIKTNLYYYDRSVILDANNQTINIGGNWYNQYSGTFIPGTGEVVFDGGAVNQYVYLGSSVDNPFYKFTVDKSDEDYYVSVSNHDNIVKNDLLVHSGMYSMSNNYTTYVSNNMIAQNKGTFNRSGTYEINNTSGTVLIQTNGSELNNITINSGGTVQLVSGDVLNVYGNFTLQQGVFDANGNEVYLGDNLDVISIAGEYQVGAGGTLYLGSQSTLSVKSGGVFKVVGTSTSIANVKSRSGTYYFNVESGGEIHAQYYQFRDMRSAGIKIADGATIDATNNFSNGTFANPTRGGTCLDVENTQEFQGASRIENVSFPDNPGGGTVNVRKDNTASGILEFYNASGLLSGADYESDPYEIINWTGDITLTWTGSVSSDWFVSDNWSSSSGAIMIPNENTSVIIPSGPTNFPEINADSARAKSLTIESNATLTVNNTSASGRTLIVSANVQVDGTFNMTNTTDTVEVTGNWVRGTGGIFNAGSGTVVLNGIGAISLNNRTSSFNNLVVDVNGEVNLNADININNDLLVESGSFDVTSSDYDVTVGGDFVIEGEFIAQAGKVILQSSGANVLNPGSSEFYDLEIKSGTYTLTDNNLVVNRNFDFTGGTLSITGLIFYMGDDSGYDDMSVSGTLELHNDATLKVGSNVSINVYSGGIISLIGSLNHEAVITNRTTGRYSLVVNSGGKFSADNYIISYLNTDGLWFKPGAILDKTTNNLSNGSFSNGESGGRYLYFENSYSSDNDTVEISNIYFNNGPTYNAKRDDASTDGVIKFIDALGVLGGYYFEDDDNSSSSGGIVWKYSDPILTWIGGDATAPKRWDNPNNWQDADGNPGVPTISTQVFINTVANDDYPVLNAGTDTVAKNVTVYSGASLTIGGGLPLHLSGDLTIAGDLIVENGSASTITVAGQYSNNGSFTHGGASTLLWITTDNNTISTSGDPFYNFIINSGGDGTGTAVFSTESSIDIDGDFKIIAGTVKVSDDAHDIHIGGDFDNQATFINSNNTVTFDGDVSQTISSSSPLVFGNLEFTGNGAKTIDVDITINDKLILNSELNTGNKTIYIKGDWTGTGTLNAGTGTVEFNGTISQRISKSETFYNLIFNNSAPTNPISLNGVINVNGQLDLTQGIITTTLSNLIVMNDGSVLGNYSSTAYINGPLRWEGNTSFKFPIGSSSHYAPLEVSDFAGTNTFTAQYLATAPSNATSLETGLNKVSDVEYWNINRDAGTGTPKITLHWTDRSYSGITDMDVLAVAYYNTSSSLWESYDTLEVVPNADTTQGYVTSGDNFSSFGDITFGFAYPTYTWEGTVSADWGDGANWSSGSVPDRQTNVKIPDVGSAFDPELSASQSTYNLTIEAGGVLRISNNELIVEGEAVINDSLVLGTNSTITFLQGFTQNGEIVNGVGASIKFNGSVEQSIGIDTCYNLIIAGSEDKTLVSDIVVLGNVDIQGDFVAGTHNIDLYGDWINSGSFDSGSGTVSFVGSVRQSITEPSTASGFNNVVINNSYATPPQIQLQSNVLFNGAVTLTDGVISSVDPNILKFGEDATVSGVSRSSFVDGKIARYGVNSFVFPIGKGAILGKIGVSDMSGSAYFEAEYFDAQPADLENRDATLKHISNVDYWELSCSGTATPKVTLYWRDSSRNDIHDHSTLTVAHYYSGNWNDEGRSASAVYADSSGYVTSANNFTQFSPIAIGSTSDDNPLPIELSYVEAYVNGDNVEVVWETESERNSSYFTVERTVDMKSVEKLGVVDGAGNSLMTNTYKFIDKEPVSGVSYYRITQTDDNGQVEAFDWIAVHYTKSIGTENLINISIYPNPGEQSDVNILIDVASQGSYSIDILDTQGKVIYARKQDIDYNKAYMFNLGNTISLESGIYLLKVYNNERVMLKRFMIK